MGYARAIGACENDVNSDLDWRFPDDPEICIAGKGIAREMR